MCEAYAFILRFVQNNYVFLYYTDTILYVQYIKEYVQ